MIVLKVVFPLLVAGAALLNALLANRWHDRRTTRNKIAQRVLLAILIFLGVCNVITAVYDHVASNRAIRQAQERHQELKGMLEPFATFASREFPHLDTKLALAKLAEEIETLKEVSRQGEYRQLNQRIANRIKSALLDARAQGLSIDTVEFYIQQGSQNRILLAHDLIGILTDAGLNARVAGQGIYPNPNPQCGILVLYAKASDRDARTVCETLAPFISTPFAGDMRSDFAVNRMQFYILGDPLYAKDGSVFFK